MTPYNYRIDAPSVVENAIQGYQTGLGSRLALRESELGMQAQEFNQMDSDRHFGLAEESEAFGQMDANRQFGLAQQEHQAQQAQIARQNALQNEQAARGKALQARLGELARNPDTTVEDWAGLLGDFPEMQQSIKGTWDAIDEGRRGVEARNAAQLLSMLNVGKETADGSQKMFIDMALGLSDANKNSGNDELGATYQGLANMAQFDPDMAEAMLATTLAAVDTEGQYAHVINNGRVGVQTSKILDDGTTVQVMRDGQRRVLNASGEEVTGKAAADAIASAQQFGVDIQGDRSEARQSGTNEANIDTGGTAAASVDAGKQSVQMSGDAWSAYGNIMTNIGNIDSAIAAIDEGGESGIIAKYLPNISQESASLQNALDRMGLDVVGAVTFGALSQKELQLAMQTAAPRDLGPQALRGWLVERKEAQEKTAAMLADAAQFLSTPGNTLNDWVTKNKGGQAPATSSPSQPDIRANMGQATLDDQAQLDQLLQEFQ